MLRVMIQGENGPILKVDDQGQARVILYGANGQPLFSDSNPAQVQLSGSSVSIGSITYQFDPPRTLYGLSTDRPDPAETHAAIPFAFYYSVDTQTVEQTDGTQWVVV